ncbi:hypothetical protein HDV06_000665 [Boothiomyces sp. JEL0866]|nr:hypothetical protein HDV06_000665 [Boothiomyces sp. JEL0866]
MNLMKWIHIITAVNGQCRIQNTTVDITLFGRSAPHCQVVICVLPQHIDVGLRNTSAEYNCTSDLCNQWLTVGLTHESQDIINRYYPHSTNTTIEIDYSPGYCNQSAQSSKLVIVKPPPVQTSTFPLQIPVNTEDEPSIVTITPNVVNNIHGVHTIANPKDSKGQFPLPTPKPPSYPVQGSLANHFTCPTDVCFVKYNLTVTLSPTKDNSTCSAKLCMSEDSSQKLYQLLADNNIAPDNFTARFNIGNCDLEGINSFGGGTGYVLGLSPYVTLPKLKPPPTATTPPAIELPSGGGPDVTIITINGRPSNVPNSHSTSNNNPNTNSNTLPLNPQTSNSGNSNTLNSINSNGNNNNPTVNTIQNSNQGQAPTSNSNNAGGGSPSTTPSNNTIEGSSGQLPSSSGTLNSAGQTGNQISSNSQKSEGNSGVPISAMMNYWVIYSLFLMI